MNYDLALAQAMHYANAEHDIAVVWHYAEQPSVWTWASYVTCELLDAIDIRYVLPHGEITKLS